MPEVRQLLIHRVGREAICPLADLEPVARDQGLFRVGARVRVGVQLRKGREGGRGLGCLLGGGNLFLAGNLVSGAWRPSPSRLLM